MAEDNEMVQPALIAHRAESQQGSQGFACPWACKHQEVAGACLKFEPAPQQLGQLLLPSPRLNLPRLNLPRLHRDRFLDRAAAGGEIEADG